MTSREDGRGRNRRGSSSDWNYIRKDEKAATQRTEKRRSRPFVRWMVVVDEADWMVEAR